MRRIANNIDTMSKYMVAFFFAGPALLATRYATHIHPEQR